MYSEVVIFKFLLRKRISITDYQTLKITVYQINGLLESDKLGIEDPEKLTKYSQLTNYVVIELCLMHYLTV